MTPSDEDSPIIRDARSAITKDLQDRYRDPDLQNYLHRATHSTGSKVLPYLEEASHQEIFSDIITDIMENEEEVLWSHFV